MEQRKKVRIEKKKEATAAAQEMRVAFDKCTPIFQCGLAPCPQAKLKLCGTCGDIKPHACRKAKCVAARRPLMLTMSKEAAAAPLALLEA